MCPVYHKELDKLGISAYSKCMYYYGTQTMHIPASSMLVVINNI